MLIEKTKVVKRLAPAALGVMGLLLAGAAAHASIIMPHSGPVTTPGTVTFAGLTAVADQVIPFTGVDAFATVKFGGTLENKVYQEPSGTLDFAYQVNANNTGPDSIHTLSVSSYSNFITDVDWVAGTGAVTYATVNRLAVLNGNTLTFDYSPSANAIAPGLSSDWILIKTNAIAYNNLGNTSVIDGGSANVPTFQPVPEPASISLLVLAAGAVLTRRSRRQR